MYIGSSYTQFIPRDRGTFLRYASTLPLPMTSALPTPEAMSAPLAPTALSAPPQAKAQPRARAQPTPEALPAPPQAKAPHCIIHNCNVMTYGPSPLCREHHKARRVCMGCNGIATKIQCFANNTCLVFCESCLSKFRKIRESCDC